MNLLRWICKHFSCVSTCKFNDQEFNPEILTQALENFELKNKDLIRIGSILNKRKRCNPRLSSIYRKESEI